MKVNELIGKINDVLKESTIYIQGAAGEKLTQANKLKFSGSTYFNASKAKLIFNADENTRGFDEIGLVSYVTGEKFSNVGDVAGACVAVSKNFATIIPGEIVFMKDRVGIFVGGNKVVTVSPNGVGTTILDGWVSHGQLKSVEYAGPAPEPVQDEIPVLVEVSKISTETVEEAKEDGEKRDPEGRVDFRNNRARHRH